MVRELYRQITTEFKEQALERLSQGISAVALAKELGIARSTVYRWAAELNEGTSGSPKSRADAEEEIKSLRRQLKRVQEERDILKKAAAFFAKQST